MMISISIYHFRSALGSPNTHFVKENTPHILNAKNHENAQDTVYNLF